MCQVPRWAVLTVGHWVHGMRCRHIFGYGGGGVCDVREWHVVSGQRIDVHGVQHWPVLEGRRAVLKLQRRSVRERHRHIHVPVVLTGIRQRVRSCELCRVCCRTVHFQLIVTVLRCLRSRSVRRVHGVDTVHGVRRRQNNDCHWCVVVQCVCRRAVFDGWCRVCTVWHRPVLERVCSRVYGLSRGTVQLRCRPEPVRGV